MNIYVILFIPNWNEILDLLLFEKAGSSLWTNMNENKLHLLLFHLKIYWGRTQNICIFTAFKWSKLYEVFFYEYKINEANIKLNVV